MVHFTGQDRVPMVFDVGQIRAIERAHRPDCARVILHDKFEGRNLYWTLEPYQVIRDRLTAAETDLVEGRHVSTLQDSPASQASRWLAQAEEAAQAHLDLHARESRDLCHHKITIQSAKGRPEPLYLAWCSCGWGQV
jgi:hypothetical protein